VQYPKRASGQQRYHQILHHVPGRDQEDGFSLKSTSWNGKKFMTAEIYAWSGNFNNLNTEDQCAVARLVVKGKAVEGTVDDLLTRLKRTRCVAILQETSAHCIVAAAAWRPGVAYRQSKFKAAGAPIAGFEAALELGYVVRAAAMQGQQLSGGLIDTVVQQITEPTFATTSSNTIRFHLERVGFSRVGGDWQGKNGMLSLWTIKP
jgi:hypothetical protein